MRPHRRPPEEITAAEFFTAWLPAELERLGSGSNIPEMLVRIELAGEGGGAWDLHMVEGSLQVGPPDPAAQPLVRLDMTEQDWRAIVVGEPGPVDLTPPSASPTDLLFVDSAARQLLATVQGTYLFAVHHYNGRTWRLRATFGGEPPTEQPVATISIEAETYAAILARELAAPEAYFNGKITIEGDAGLGMQVGLALLPKF